MLENKSSSKQERMGKRMQAALHQSIFKKSGDEMVLTDSDFNISLNIIYCKI